MWFHGIFALRGRTPEELTFTYITSTEVRYLHHVLPWSGGHPLASLSGISTRRRPQPIHSAIHLFWYVWVSVSCLWFWCDRKRACGKFRVTAACAFGAIPRLSLKFAGIIPTRAPGRPIAKESQSIGVPWRPSWRRQPRCWQNPFGYYRWWAAWYRQWRSFRKKKRFNTT